MAFSCTATSENAARQSRRIVSRAKNVISPADHVVIREHYTFLPSERNTKTITNDHRKGEENDSSCKEGVGSKNENWQERMVKSYHDHLYKEFALADLSIPGRIGLRWRTREEVVSGRGERTCGNKRCKINNDERDDLVTLEVPFSYREHGVRKKELVKLRLCQSCRPLLSNLENNNITKTMTNYAGKSEEEERRHCSSLNDRQKTGGRRSRKCEGREGKAKKRRKGNANRIH